MVCPKKKKTGSNLSIKLISYVMRAYLNTHAIHNIRKKQHAKPGKINSIIIRSNMSIMELYVYFYFYLAG